ncbi:hypothetical protein F0562_011406 [Nyssa sinensis]|uniref:Uncharacterized protein n=1 Tax=Nyssa sinensis TaxID=561372 RepID=A0A5J5A4K1_9ASTE|nr:hypothetical protein F0562_011406 [Nyssa sinensis]
MSRFGDDVLCLVVLVNKRPTIGGLDPKGKKSGLRQEVPVRHLSGVMIWEVPPIGDIARTLYFATDLEGFEVEEESLGGRSPAHDSSIATIREETELLEGDILDAVKK